MEPHVTIRRMESRDIKGVVRVYEEVFDESYISFAELEEGKADGPQGPYEPAVVVFENELKEFLEHSEALLLVACVDRDLVGFALAELRRARAGHIECWLHDMGVSAAWRGQGIGHALAEPLMEWGTQAGAKYFLLETGVSNDLARRMFQELGFSALSTVFWRPVS